MRVPVKLETGSPVALEYDKPRKFVPDGTSSCEFAFYELACCWIRIRRESNGMRIISKARLRAFWQRPGQEDAAGPLRAWHAHVSHRTVAWQTWADVKAEFGSASLVGNCVVFNIGGNKYRMVTRILYPSQKVFILKMMTHAEYDRDQWKKDCGCYQAPQPRPQKKQKPA